MSRLLRRTATCAVLAALATSTLSQAQSTAVAVPDRTLYRRELPAAPLPTATPIVQQSPNGLYQMSISDTGIVLRGPKGTVTLNAAGVLIGGRGTQVKVESDNLELKVARDSQWRSGLNLTLDAASNVTVRGGATTQVSGAAGTTITGAMVRLGCGNKPVARLGDQLTVSGNGGTIAQGSPTVLVC